MWSEVWSLEEPNITTGKFTNWGEWMNELVF